MNTTFGFEVKVKAKVRKPVWAKSEGFMAK